MCYSATDSQLHWQAVYEKAWKNYPKTFTCACDESFTKKTPCAFNTCTQCNVDKND